MGCGSSSGPAYPKQQYTNGGYPSQQYSSGNQPGAYYGPTGPMMVGGGCMHNNNDDRFVEGALVGGAVGMMAAHQMGGGYQPVDLPGGYHLGPRLPNHSVEVMGVDIM
ncbi:uncharacterized protein LOC106156610 [Lingula anatina]|uniref:Uncharacterized protein LOC106156610 n=1 Tax=Lingula anatina TaxID=7574 RepID=A0A1S3HQT1_LINAN|nr:uncharacterized protein LOC106156610 [Lingula anatina]XP_013387395.1 uncharacterized protein LOC106156610 [Lingula anatina]|eukprot:XP_013387394.1 uncharacterized protein LOC106156610 [Lingula anatina]